MNLKEWRYSLGISVNKAAKILNVPQPSLSRIEAGKRWPSPATIEKIVKNSGGKITAGELCASIHAARATA
jgi:transcriptional regulator with XRE-family HTH domain